MTAVPKANGGLTLLEATIALAVFMVLSASIVAVWQHTARSAALLLARQHAFEQARGSLDVMVMNVQMAQSITLRTDTNDTLELMTLNQLRQNPNNPAAIEPWNFDFIFNINGAPGTIAHQTLRFSGPTNEFARNIGNIIVEVDRYPSPQRMYISIITACLSPREPITVHGSIDIRYKNFSRG